MMEDRMAEEQAPRYKITNVVRRVNTRIRRVAAPGRRRFKQYVCGKRLLRKQIMWITAAEMEQYKTQLLAQVREGAIEITTPEGAVLRAGIDGRIITQGPGAALIGKEPAAPPPPPPPTEAPAVTPQVEVPEHDQVPEPKADTLTELPGVGIGRARKLEAAGITTFKQIAEMAPGALLKILGPPMTEDQAADICNAASEREG